MNELFTLTLGADAPLFHQAAGWVAQAFDIPTVLALVLCAGGLFGLSMGGIVLAYQWLDERPPRR